VPAGSIGFSPSKIRFANRAEARHVYGMSTVEEIKTAISKLPLEERAEIAAELCGWVHDEWDKQMKTDAVAGKFSSLNRDADAANQAGQTVSLNDILREP
jgi:hypothetical protein